VVLTGVAVFTLASVGCALSSDITHLIFFRALQGLATGAGIVVSRAVIRDMFPPADAQRVMSQVTLFFGVAPAIAPIIGGFLFGGLACKWRKVPVLPMFDLTAMGFLVGQCCGRWGNFFNQEAFGCNTTLPWGMYSEGTRSYLMGSTVTVQNGVTIDPNLPVHPTFLYESIWCLVGFILLFRYIKKRKFNGDITLRYLVWSLYFCSSPLGEMAFHCPSLYSRSL
jgi:phosphatidylglycerol:prolipoprotein diacylglycerol transferase